MGSYRASRARFERGQRLKPRVLIIGAFGAAADDGRTGGMAFACQSLIRSDLANTIEFVPVDSSISSIRARSGLRRLPSAIGRLVAALWQLTFGGVKTCLCFSSFGNSFLEKGLLVVMGSWLGRRMILLPRSGHLLADIEGKRWFAHYVRFVMLRASVVVCQSDWWRKYYSNLVPAASDKFVVIENWLPGQAFVGADEEVAASRSPDFIVGYMNRIEAEKGIYDFLEVIRLARARQPRIRGVVYGDGSDLEAMLDLINSPANQRTVSYAGWVDGDDKRNALRSLDAYLFVSHAEGFPNSLLEVLALKVPVVSVRVGAVVDVLADGRSALLAGVSEIQALADHLVRLSEDRELRSRVAEEAYVRVRTRNNLAEAIRKFAEILA